MRLRARRLHQDRGTSGRRERPIDAARKLMDAGRWTEAIDLLTSANRAAPDPSVEALLVSARHSAFASLDVGEPDPDWPRSFPDLFGSGPRPPEVDAAELEPQVLGSALSHHGSLVVRNLLDADTTARLQGIVERAFDASAAHAAGAPVTETSPWFHPFEADDGYDFGFLEQSAARLGGGVLLAESPRALSAVVDAYQANGLGSVLEGYLGEWPALSVKKSTLRRAGPESETSWHQDGAFLGLDVHTVNVWTSLSDCGVDAPGIELFARRFDHLVATGTEGAKFHWSVSDAEAARYGRDQVVSPTFSPGDALLFDQTTLHQTGITPQMSRERLAIETWFFAPSTYPLAQVPVLF